jgi:hypothetical protein
MEDKFKGTRLTLEIDGVKVSWESPHNDYSVEELLSAMRGLLVSHTYMDNSFITVCGDIYEENKFLLEKEKEDD